MEHVSAIIVTRGDVDLTPVLESLPPEWQTIIWDNSKETDLSVYGRYAAIERADHDLIYVQDDDCVVSDPQRLVDVWHRAKAKVGDGHDFDPKLLWQTDNETIQGVARGEHVVCNMPPEFRHDFYEDHALVGFGACFHRDAPQRAFVRIGLIALPGSVVPDIDFFYRTCDIAFTALTPRVLVDVPKTNLWWAEDESRMYRQPQHVEERTRMLELVRKVRDAG